MKTYEECIPCVDRQLIKLAEMLSDDPAMQRRIRDAGKQAFDHEDMNCPPPYFAQKVHRAIRKISGVADPYADLKRQYNHKALNYVPRLKKMILESDNRFRQAVLISLAGNIIDFGAGSDFKLMDTILRVLGEDPVVDEITDLENAISKAHKILFIGDNAGETVMDRLLIEEISTAKDICYSVRGGPILNDATIEDAMVVGLDRYAKLLSNGSDAPGIILDDCSTAFRREFENADLIIAKGMGNYESLSEICDSRLFFILLIKCKLVARHIGYPKGGAVVMRSRRTGS
jgi:damage-control phosphatase, subfamily I